MNNIQKSFGNKLRELRKNKGLTQERLGEKIGVSANAIGQFERGKILPNLNTVASIIDALDVDANLFFERSAADYSEEAKWMSRILDRMSNEEKRIVGHFLKDISGIILSSKNIGGEHNEDSNM